MEKIASFTVDHMRLKRGLYVSRKDREDESIVTTFDIRMKEPNKEPVMDTAAIHAIEHIGATFLRNNSEYKEKVVYFGPMGCRTGFYLILFGDHNSKDILPLVIDMFKYIASFSGDIPGASAEECGNYLDLNANMASYEASRYLFDERQGLLTSPCLEYPE